MNWLRAPSRLLSVCALLGAAIGAGCIDADKIRAEIEAEQNEPDEPQGPLDPGVVDPGGEDPSDPSDPPPSPGADDDGVFKLLTVEPNEGLVTGIEEVMITGGGFVEGMGVLFDDSPAIDLFIVSPKVAVMRTPPHPAGRVDVHIYHPDINGGQPETLELAYLYYSEIELAEVQPSEGDVRGGDSVTVIGSGFGPKARFFVDGHLAIAQERVDDNTLVGITPPGRYGKVDVFVDDPDSTTSTVMLEDGFRYRDVPSVALVEPIAGPAEGGSLVRLEGAALGGDDPEDVLVRFGAGDARVIDGSNDGSWLTVESPAGPGGDVADIQVTTGWGLGVAEDAWTWIDPTDDPEVLSCATLFPSSGPTEGGQSVMLACQGTSYGVDVRFGESAAEIIEVDAAGQTIHVVAPPHAEGTVPVRVQSPFSDVIVGKLYTYEGPPSVRVDGVSPASGPVEGGTRVTVSGAGFEPGMALYVGALAATDVQIKGATSLEATTAAGTPGAADVRLVAAGLEAVLEDGFDYTSDQLAFDLIAPPAAAQAGGTYLRVHGTGFASDAQVFIGGQALEIIERVGSAEIHARSPKLPVDIYDAWITSGGETVERPHSFTTFDPRSGYGGTWGEGLDETVNVTVRGTQGYGPISGAFVMVGEDPLTTLKGYTDENGQITFSEPGLHGPVQVTASHPDFDTYSVVHFDAMNLTVYLSPKNPPSGSPPPPGPPDAIVRGKVLGLGKYVIPPPGSCEAVAIDETDHCRACDLDNPCESDGFACVEVKDQGDYCLGACGQPEDCPIGYVCAASLDGTRCLPAPGEKIAKCMISNTSPFSTEPTVPETGWVKPGGTYELPSGRLGELAIVCFGGYRDDELNFTPTMLGVLRHVFVDAGQTYEDLDVQLTHPLDRTFRLRLADPPTWPSGVDPPTVTISLDLGPDGAIPFTRPLIDAGDHTWLASRQLGELAGDLYDGQYFFYSTLSASTLTKTPRSYNLVQGITSVVEDRLPVFGPEGWELEQIQLDRDLNGLWGETSDQIYAVGEDGLILLHNGVGWTAQSSGVEDTLLAVDGRAANDVWAAGERGALLHWDGTSWQAVAGTPKDTFAAIATAAGQPVYVAGEIRVRRYEAGALTIEGPPSLQGIRGLAASEDGQVVAVGIAGRIFHRSPAGSWTALPSPTDADLADVWFDPATAEAVVVGAKGTLLQGDLFSGLTAIEGLSKFDLTAVTRGPDGTLFVVGDEGRALRREPGGAWVSDLIPDYRSRAQAVLAPADGGPVRVVGSAAFILGPYLHFPIMTAPLHESSLDGLTMAWTWDGGEPNSYTHLVLSESTGKTLWTLVVDGSTTSVDLPDIFTAAGFEALGSGQKRVSITRVLNENFDIDDYTTREFSIYRRDSWTQNQSTFYAP